MTILFVSGVNDPSTAAITLDDNGNIAYRLTGNCSVEPLLPLKDGLAATFLIFGKYVKQPNVQFKTTPSLIFNQIADPDTHRGALERCADLCDQVNTSVINHPRKVLETSRDQVAQTLQGIPHVVVPRTQRFRPRSPEEVFSRASAEGFGFPFIVRMVGLHDGKGTVKIDSRDDYALLHVLPFDGREFYLSEFIDCRDDQGLYHVQRIAMIDGAPFLRHALFDEHWNVSEGSWPFMLERETWDAIHAREALLENERIPALQAAFAEIAKRLQLEYFGIDCCLGEDGRLVVFEANAGMNMLFNPQPEMGGRMERFKEKLYQLLTRYSGERVI
jgi:hypothetical protein